MWMLRSKEKIMQPMPNILRDDSYLVWDGEIHRPGTYELKKGTIVTWRMTVKNVGSEGNVYCMLYDDINGRVLFGKMIKMVAGGIYTFNGSFTVDRDMKVKMVTWWWDGKKWVRYDEYGC